MQAAESNAGTGSQVGKGVNPGTKLHARALRPGPSSRAWKTVTTSSFLVGEAWKVSGEVAWVE